MKKYLYVVAMVLLIGIAIIFGQTIITKKNVPTNTALPSDGAPETNKKEIGLTIDYGDDSAENFIVGYENDMTAYEALKKISDEKNIILETKDYANLGIFIEKIGKKKNGDGSKYWLYSINGTQPSVAADKIKIQPGDTVKFSFEKSPF